MPPYDRSNAMLPLSGLWQLRRRVATKGRSLRSPYRRAEIFLRKPLPTNKCKDKTLLRRKRHPESRNWCLIRILTSSCAHLVILNPSLRSRTGSAKQSEESLPSPRPQILRCAQNDDLTNLWSPSNLLESIPKEEFWIPRANCSRTSQFHPIFRKACEGAASRSKPWLRHGKKRIQG